MEALVPTAQLATEDTVCRVAIRRAEDARQESRMLGFILIGLVAVVALALSIVIGLAVVGEHTAAIVAAVGAVVDGAAAGFVVKRKGDANNSAKGALDDAKGICSSQTTAQLPA
jgi:hypothetical protein